MIAALITAALLAQSTTINPFPKQSTPNVDSAIACATAKNANAACSAAIEHWQRNTLAADKDLEDCVARDGRAVKAATDADAALQAALSDAARWQQLANDRKKDELNRPLLSNPLVLIGLGVVIGAIGTVGVVHFVR